MNSILPLPIRVPYIEREPPFSFMSRIAAANGVSPAQFGRELGVSFSSIIKGDWKAVSKLAELGGLEPERLISWASITQNGRRVFRGENFDYSKLMRSDVRGCPVCLRQDIEHSRGPEELSMAFRGEWLLTYTTICIEHSHEIVPLWKEKNSLRRYDIVSQFQGIRSSILSGALDRPLRTPTAFEGWIFSRLQGALGDTFLDHQPLNAAATFCRLLGHALMHHRLGANMNAKRIPVYEKCQVGFGFARNGKTAIRAAFDEIKESSEPYYSPVSVYPRLFAHFQETRRENAQYDGIRNLFADHMLESWPLAPGAYVLGRRIVTRQLHSVITASDETGMDPDRLRNLLISEGLIDGSRSNHRAVFSAPSAASFLAAVGEKVLMEQQRILANSDVFEALCQRLDRARHTL